MATELNPYAAPAHDAGAVMMRTVVATKMDDTHVWIKVARPFLESIRRSV